MQLFRHEARLNTFPEIKSRLDVEVKTHSIVKPTLIFLQTLQRQVGSTQKSLANVFQKKQPQLIDLLINYTPLSYSNIDLTKNGANYDQIRLVKNTNRIYFGGLKDGERAGSGVMIDDKGKIYEGNFDKNVKSGNGVEIYANGNIFIGNFDKNKKHGKGKFFWFNLSSPIKNANQMEFYEGTWWGGLPDGKGFHQKVNGDCYSGDFKNGLKHGKGHQIFHNGDLYEGDYINGLPEGVGNYLWKDGSRYIGDFKQGLRSGNGIWKSGDNREIYSGQYIMDKKAGFGQYTWMDGKYVYKGNFQNDVRNGYGQLQKNGQEEYKGQWANGKIKQNLHDMTMKERSIQDKSFLKSPKSEKFPSVGKIKAGKLKPSSSSFLKEITQLAPKKKMFSRSKSPKQGTQSLKKISNNFKVVKSKSQLNFNKTLKQRPISMINHHHGTDHTTKYQLLVRKCTKRNCGCNVSIPLSSSNPKKLLLRSNHIKTEPFYFD